MSLLTIILCSFSFLCLIQSIFLWPNHDISTLKLLQIVHRHGSRTPNYFYPNDPFRNESEYWYEGIGELTIEGKHRMYKLGKFIRNEYQQYLGQTYSPREVYVRSSAQRRCLESVSCLLAGAYPPNTKQWQWNNGSNDELGLHWQPFPIETFIPKDDDDLLRNDKYCPNADKELDKIRESQKVLDILKNNEIFLKNLSVIVGKNIVSLREVNPFFDTIKIEFNRGYKWSDMKIWDKKYEKLVFDTLSPIAKLSWIVEWDNRLIERTRAGNLIRKLTENMENKIQQNINSNNNFKLFLYSTHDTMLAVLMNALNVYNNEFIPFGASLLLELHQNKSNSNYFIRLYYYNETLTDKSPHLLTFPDCNQRTDCPIDKFLSFTKDLIPKNWDKECGIETRRSFTGNNNLSLLNSIFFAINIISLFVLINLILLKLYSLRKQSSYESFK